MSRHLQPVDNMFGPAVTNALGNVALTEADGAAVLLAKRYAKAIDDADDRDVALEKFGPRLLSVLEALRATPKSRAAVKPAPKASGKLASLRAARTA